MSDADVVRLVPIYVAIKELSGKWTASDSVFHFAGQLEHLVEQAIMSDGIVNEIKAQIALDALLAAARLMVERAEAIKVMLDEVATP